MTVYINGRSANIISTTHESLHCFLCYNILENPHQAPCGCRFCFNCIIDYIKDGDKICPVQSDDCSKEKLNFKKDLKFDVLAKREINKLIVSCPFYECDKECELQEMKDHIEICAFATLFCKACDTDIVKSEYVDHESNKCAERMVTCEFCHEIMKIKYITEEHQNYEHDNLCTKYSGRCPNECGEEGNVVWFNHRRLCSNKVVSCPYKVVGCSSNNDTLTSISRHMTEDGFYHAEELLKYIDNVNNEVKQFRNELMETVEKEREKVFNGLQEQNMRIDNTNEAVKEVISRCNSVPESAVLNEMNEKIEKLKDEVNCMRKSYETQFMKEIYTLRRSNEFLENEVMNLKNILNPLQIIPQIKKKDPIFNWKVTDFSTINNAFSPMFYTHSVGYKLDLELKKVVKGFLSLFVRLKCGKYDKLLPWPFRKKIIIKILDQENLNRNYEKTIHFDIKAGNVCQRKYLTEQGAYGFREFISYTELKESQYLLKNNIIWIQCFVEELYS